MSSGADWDCVKQLFQEALDAPPDARLAFVQARASDAQVRQEVMSLLQAYPSAEGFLSTPADPAQVRAILARLDTGDELGPFRITALIGAGGMGEVYRAWDTRLDRHVAIKVVPQASSIDGAARERFEAEARAISRLTHPRISTLYDVGSASIGSATVQYLVMELVDGETLAARLGRSALRVDEALAIAIDIAEALAAAHAAGVVHGDVKPANIMLTRSGAKLLDFGLARLRPSPLTAASAHLAAGDPATQRTGLLGTLPYMAPELLRGAASDARTDLFAFGAVLYEMLTGSAAFVSESDADLVAAILEREPPPIASRQPLTPPTLARLVVACLAKDPQDRWQTSQDLVRALRWIRDDRSRPEASTTTTGVVSWKVLASVTVAAAALIGALAIAAWKRPTVNPSRVAFPVFATAGTQFPRGTAELAVAPDGSGLVFVAIASTGTRQLWLRRFDGADNHLLAGTDGAARPFWSPDARWIAFVAGGKLWKIAPTGGQPQVVCDAQPSARGTWNHDGTILFSGDGQSISRVSENGGLVSPVTVLDRSRGDVGHSFPVFLPDGRRFVYLAVRRGDGLSELFQGSLDSTEIRRVAASEANVGVADRYLMSLNKGVLVAQRYDPNQAALDGSPIEIADHIVSDPPLRSGSPFSVGAGVIAYRSASPNSRLLWFDRMGRQLDAFAGAGDWHHPRLSPDEKSMLIEKTDPSTGRHTIWILDLLRGTSSRLIIDPYGAHHPGWSPDGRRIVFSSNRLGGLALFLTRSDGSGDPAPVLPGEKAFAYVADWSANGRFLLYEIGRAGNTDLWISPFEGDRTPYPFLSSPARETQGQFSPDGTWIAYTSDESGSPEVYVRRFPDTGIKWRISTHGGVQARWRHDGKELFYLALDGRLMAVDIKASSSSLEAGAPHVLFVTGITGSFVDRFNQYVVTRDGQRFLVNRSAEDENSAPITVVMHWDAGRQ
jgi:eukaryotic-like serine/threonine-protein kinase